MLPSRLLRSIGRALLAVLLGACAPAPVVCTDGLEPLSDHTFVFEVERPPLFTPMGELPTCRSVDTFEVGTMLVVSTDTRRGCVLPIVEVSEVPPVIAPDLACSGAICGSFVQTDTTGCTGTWEVSIRPEDDHYVVTRIFYATPSPECEGFTVRRGDRPSCADVFEARLEP